MDDGCRRADVTAAAQNIGRVFQLDRNPFRHGMGLDPPYLADRQYQLQRFARYLDGYPERATCA